MNTRDTTSEAHYYGLPGEHPRGDCACGNPVPVEPLDPPTCPVCGAMFCDGDCRAEHMEVKHGGRDD